MSSQKDATRIELAQLLEEKARRLRYNRFETLFPETGPYRAELYPKHIAFMNASKDYSQRAFIGANRSGKTLTGAFEMTCHLTGIYRKNWKGRRFVDPIEAWAASLTNEMTKNVMQKELLGDPMDLGSGIIPKDLIVKIVKKPGVADAVETCYIKHISGRLSRLDFKAYEQGRIAFQGTKKQVIWLDEEPTDPNIYSECLTRTMDFDNPGIIYCTFTPLFGLSDVVLSFMPDGQLPDNGVDSNNPYKYVTQVSWEEVPHLSEKQKTEMMASYSDYERNARTRGIPSLGSGVIYPYFEEDYVVPPFEPPSWFKKAYGMDVGWDRTAVVWGAYNPADGCVTLYSEHYMGQEKPMVHAHAIKSRGRWIAGAIDPRGADNRSQIDGTRLLDLYQEEGLILHLADNSVESGIYKVSQMLASGRLKICSNLVNLLKEIRTYRRDEKGKIVKKNDHLMDAMRYLIVSGLDYADSEPDPDDDAYSFHRSTEGRSKVCGY